MQWQMRREEDGRARKEVRAHAQRHSVRHWPRHLLPTGDLSGMQLLLLLPLVLQ